MDCRYFTSLRRPRAIMSTFAVLLLLIRTPQSLAADWRQVTCTKESPVGTDWLQINPKRVKVAGNSLELTFNVVGATAAWDGFVAVSEDGARLFSLRQQIGANEVNPVTIKIYRISKGRHEFKVALDVSNGWGFAVCPTFPGKLTVDAP